MAAPVRNILDTTSYTPTGAQHKIEVLNYPVLQTLDTRLDKRRDRYQVTYQNLLPGAVDMQLPVVNTSRLQEGTRCCLWFHGYRCMTSVDCLEQIYIQKEPAFETVHLPGSECLSQGTMFCQCFNRTTARNKFWKPVIRYFTSNLAHQRCCHGPADLQKMHEERAEVFLVMVRHPETCHIMGKKRVSL
jgi:hypothetical protein